MLALLLGVGDARQQLGVAVLGVHVHEVNVELLGEHLLDLFGLVLAQQAVVHEHAGQLAADGLRAERRHHGRVDAARKAQDDAVFAHLRANRGDGVLDDGVHGPVLLEAADTEQEVLQQVVTVRGVAHLRMELRGVQLALGALHGGDGADVGLRGHEEAFWRAAHGVAVAHPHGLLGGRVPVQGGSAVVRARERGRAVLALLGVAHFATQRDGHDLLSVAEAEHRDAQLQDLGVDGGGVLGVDAGGAAGEDDGGGGDGADFVGRDVARHDLGVDVQVAHAAGDQLAVLGAEVEDEDFLACVGGFVHVLCSFCRVLEACLLAYRTCYRMSDAITACKKSTR